ncbi:methyltransferase [Mycobacterium sp. 1245111.1]|uniref:class I SAM-dependent methyltransferase n=1 Tax=Mycobacterium sp. 1245111.1 TaxID=1834073 RepID=UPI000801DA55|nr:class I SAM-dependent methyltransferase [Mycobacterium sp. 1245111.1]OBK36512.1 methyltransferase [Mycobacterium sp. 1245111.1]
MLDWDHNAYYHRLLLRQLPPHSRRVLDVGCGAGSFAARLAGRIDHVDAIDRSSAMIEVAAQRTPHNVTCMLGDVMTHPLIENSYDAIFSISALHHVDLSTALPRLAALLRPGGVLAVIALPRKDLRAELPTEVVAALGHRLLGAAFLLARSVGRGDWFAKDSTHSTMPTVLAPELTTREVAGRSAAILAGAHVRRLIFWRYLLRWEKPALRS